MKKRHGRFWGAVGACACAFAIVAAPAVALASSFPDVPDGQWYTDSVEWANSHGLITGYDNGYFGVGDTLNRAQVATILWRNSVPAAERPDTYSTVNATDMSDVSSRVWYTAAANWAVQNLVINGYENGDGSRSFGPNDPVTTEQFVTILGNYANMMISHSTVLDSIYNLSDSWEVDSWANHSVQWSLDTGLVSGVPNGDGTSRFLPLQNVPRERAATILARGFQNGVLPLEGKDAPKSESPFIVEYGYTRTQDNHVKVAMTIQNPNPLFAAENASYFVTGIDNTGRPMFVDQRPLSYLAPGETVTFVCDSGNGTDFYELSTGYVPSDYCYTVGDPSISNNYEVTNVNHPQTSDLHDVFTGYVTMKKADQHSSTAYVSVVYRDADGNMIGGAYTYVPNLAPGVPTPFEVDDWNAPSTMASYEVHAMRP